jgi:hypothetical protein
MATEQHSVYIRFEGMLHLMIRQMMQAACVNQSCDASNVSSPHYTVGIRSGYNALPCLVVRNQTTAVAGSYVI